MQTGKGDKWGLPCFLHITPLAEKDVIWFLISSSCRGFHGMLQYATAHIAAVQYLLGTCRLGLIRQAAFVLITTRMD